jgi:glutathionyl-hydroquinone reductase
MALLHAGAQPPEAHYSRSHDDSNPTGLVAAGPVPDPDAPVESGRRRW